MVTVSAGVAVGAGLVVPAPPQDLGLPSPRLVRLSLQPRASKSTARVYPLSANWRQYASWGLQDWPTEVSKPSPEIVRVLTFSAPIALRDLSTAAFTSAGASAFNRVVTNTVAAQTTAAAIHFLYRFLSMVASRITSQYTARPIRRRICAGLGYVANA